MSQVKDVLPNDKFVVYDGLFLTNLKDDIKERVNLKDKNPEKVLELLELREKYLETLKD